MLFDYENKAVDPTEQAIYKLKSNVKFLQPVCNETIETV